MASKITPLYAKTRILLQLWALEKTPVAKSHFVPNGKAYKAALEKLVEDGSLAETPNPKKKGSIAYLLADSGKTKLAESLADKAFEFSAMIGQQTTNALLHWIRTTGVTDLPSEPSKQQATVPIHQNGSNGNNGNGSNGKVSQISSYREFTETALNTYDQLNRDYNLDDLVPIYRIRREIGDRLPRQQFNEWLLEIQANDLVQLMGSNLSDVTADQMEDSLTIPGAGARFFVKRLS